jgi:lactate dehydrogenase-like 2-hydroxyacid dehydrogenase
LSSVLILTASGADSFNSVQRRLLLALTPTFKRISNPFSIKQFLKVAKPFSVIALTPKVGFKITKKIIDRLPNLKAMIVFSTGIDWIDVGELKKKNIKFLFLPDYCSDTVAEHVLGMLLTFSRRIHLSYLKSFGKIPKSISLRGFELRGKTLGLIGLGRIGKKVFRLANAFGMRVIYHDPKPQKKLHRVSLRELLKNSDFISIQCPYQGKVILDKKEIALMKKGSFLINASRKQLVSTRAIFNAIRSKKIAGYAVDDVLVSKDPFKERGRLLQTYHTAWYSDEAIQRGTAQWVEKIIKTSKPYLK